MLIAAAGHGGSGAGSLGAPSAHWDFSDITKLWQLTNETSQVSADGQKIRSVSDSVSGDAVPMHGTGDGTGILYKASIQNSLSVGRFTNAVGNDLLSTLVLAQPFTVLVVAKFASVAQSRRALFGGSGAVFGADFTNTSKLGLFEGSDHASSATLDTAWHVYTAIPNGASSKQRIDGVEVYSGNAGADPFTNPAIGNDGAGSQVMVGDIGEVALYTSVITAPELAAAEAFLADKWGL